MSTNPLPALSEAEYESLKANIAERGVLVPIIVSAGPACFGEVGDGHHRQRACAELGIECPRQDRTFDSEAEFRLFQLDTNIERRQLTPYQRWELAKAREPWERQRAAERKAATQAQPGAPWIGSEDGPARKSGTITDKGETRDKIAAAVGLARSTFSRIDDVMRSGEEDLKEGVRTGALRPTPAHDELKRRQNGDAAPSAQPTTISAPTRLHVVKPRSAITHVEKRQLGALTNAIEKLSYLVEGALTFNQLVTEDAFLSDAITPDIAAQRAADLTKIIRPLVRLRKKLNERASQ